MVFSCSLDAQIPVFQALGSDIRVRIMKLIAAADGISPGQISQKLGIPPSTLSPHIAKLHECGLIRFEDVPSSHGTQKLCYLAMEQIIVSLDAQSNRSRVIQSEIPIGQYSDFSIEPTCGLSTTEAFIGKLDEPCSFTYQERFQAGILWFTTGYLEYILPNTVPYGHTIKQLSLSFELSSEAPQHNNDWPSDIRFSLNGTTLGLWTSPGDFGDRRGDLNPSWWYDFLNQYGILKNLTITDDGTFLDGERISPVTVQMLQLDYASVMKFRFSVDPGTPYSKGLTLYGRGFGDYNQGIRMTVQYE